MTPIAPTGLTADERARLQGAVDRLNAEMAALANRYGETVLIRPFCRFDDLRQIAQVEVEVHTGRVVFR